MTESELAKIKDSGPNENLMFRYKRELGIIEQKKLGKCLCNKCGDTGFIPVMYFDNRLARYTITLRRCKCVNSIAVKQTMEASGLSKELESKTFNTFKADTEFRKQIKNRAVDYLSAIAKGEKPWLYIGGQSGSGKSHLCIAIANRFFQNGYKLHYMRWIDELRQIKDNRIDNTRLSLLKNAQVLYIDDLFKVRSTEYDIALAFEIINYRDSNGLITLISSELDKEDLKQLDEAIYGRILAHTGDNFMISVEKDASKNYRTAT